MTRVLCLLCLVLLVPAAQADELDPLLAGLNSQDSAQRGKAEAALKKLVGPAQLPRLVGFFKGCQMMACYVVVRLVGDVGGAPAGQALRQMVRLRADYGAYYAASTLQYKLKDTSGMEYLLQQVRSPATAEPFRYTLISYLISMGEGGKRTLLEMAADATLSARLRSRALDRLADYTGALGDESKVVAGLGEVADPAVRLAGDIYLYTRGKLADVARLDAAALAGKLEYTQWYTLLRAIERRRDKARRKVLEYLVAKGSSGYIKAQALQVMAKIGLDQQAVRLARKYTADKDEHLRREARKLMVQYGNTSLEELKQQLEQGPLLDRLDVAEMLLKLDDPSGEAVIVRALADKNVVVRRRAAELAGRLVSRKVLIPLAGALNDADLTVRSQAHSSLRSLIDALLPYRNLDWTKLGYKVDGPAEPRGAAVQKLQAWLEQALGK